MGWISDRHMRQGGSIGGRRRRVYPKDGAPLRRVVSIVTPSRSLFDAAIALLECGHRAKSWGGLRARCPWCKAADE